MFKIKSALTKHVFRNFGKIPKKINEKGFWKFYVYIWYFIYDEQFKKTWNNFKAIKLICKKYPSLFFPLSVFFTAVKFHVSWEFSFKLRVFLEVESFLVSWEFSCKLRVFLEVESFLVSREFSFELRIFLGVENFLMIWEFSYELRVFLWVKNFLVSWEFFVSEKFSNEFRIFYEMRIFLWLENFLMGWEFSCELRILPFFHILVNYVGCT